MSSLLCELSNRDLELVGLSINKASLVLVDIALPKVNLVFINGFLYLSIVIIVHVNFLMCPFPL